VFVVILASAILMHFTTTRKDWVGNMDTFFDKLYFCMTLFSTVGFGDLCPATQKAKALVMMQSALDISTMQPRLLFAALTKSRSSWKSIDHVHGSGFVVGRFFLVTYAVLDPCFS
jgi:hypothetical protein